MINLIENKKILNIYHYGSKVYGTFNKNSDIDFIVVIDDKSFKKNYFKNGDFEYHIYQKEEFIEQLEAHKINMLECYFAPQHAIKKELFIPDFSINKELLRRSISAVCSNSWVKCNKKISQGDYYIGIKSLFHSIRILHFGIQMATFGEIVDFEECNKYWFEINDSVEHNWEYFSNKYHDMMLKKRTEFRILCPWD